MSSSQSKDAVRRNVREYLNQHEEEMKAIVYEDLKEEIVERTVQKVLGVDDGRENIEVPVGGRHNHGNTEAATLSSPSDPPTKTVEVPIQGGDVEDPATVEKEVLDPDHSEADLTEGLSQDQMGSRVNRGRDESEESVDDISPGGWRRMKEGNDE